MKIIKNMFKNQFLKNVLLITTGTASAQIITTISTPIITRIYSPEEFGVLTLYSSIIIVLSLIGSFRYEMGIPIAKNDQKSINLIGLCIFLLIFNVFIITIVLFIWGKELLGFINSASLLHYKYFIPIGIFLVGLYNIFNQWAIRNRNYKAISHTKVWQSLSQAIFKVILGILSFGPIGLIIGSIIGQSVGIKRISVGVDFSQIKTVSRKTMYGLLKKYKKFPLFSMPSVFFNTLSLQLPIIFITTLYGAGTAGLYGLAHSIVSIPMYLIGKSVADVYYGEAAKVGRSNPEYLLKLSSSLLKKLIILGFFPFIVLLIFGPYLFNFVFGESWEQAGVFAKIIAFLVFSRLIFTPLSRIFTVFEKQQVELIIDLVRIGLVIGIYIVTKLYLFSDITFISLYTASMSLVYLGTYFVAKVILKREIKSKIVNYK